MLLRKSARVSQTTWQLLSACCSPFLQSWQPNARQFATNLDAKVENHPHQSIIPQKQKKTREENFIKSFPWPWAIILRISLSCFLQPSRPPNHATHTFSSVNSYAATWRWNPAAPPKWFIDQLHRKSQHFFQVKWCLNFSRCS